MRILICGAGSTGLHVAEILSDVHDVTLVDRRPAEEIRVPDALHHVTGDAADPTVLLRAGAHDADALIAVTGDDATNLVVALLAKHRFRVRWTVALMDEPAHRWLYGPAAGVDVVVSASELVAQLVQEEVTSGDLVTLLRLRGGIAVTETVIPAGAAVAGMDAEAVALPAGTALTAVVRRDEVLLPARAGRLRAGDLVIALCEPGREHALQDLLTGPAAAAAKG